MRYKILSVCAALAAITACGDLTSINQNPNGPPDATPPSILPSVIQNVVGGVNGVNSLNIRGGGLWVQYYSEIQYRDEDKYIVRSGTSGGWGFYNGGVEDAQRMMQKGEAANATNWTAVGRVLKSYMFSVMTDAMGDLPYTQALKGDTILHPVYDSQQSIYDSLFANLAQANSEFDFRAVATGFPTGDLLYRGSMAKWQKFANSLRLRLAMHLTNVDPAKAQAEAAAAVSAGVFASNADNATLLYLSSSPNRNPIYNDARGRDDYGITDTTVINAYLAQPRVAYTPGATGLTQIAYQKWVSLFMQGMESWTEVRRTQIPALIPGPRAVFGAGIATKIPERLPYDDQEGVLNAANVAAAVAAQGFSASNDIQSPLWFTGRQ